MKIYKGIMEGIGALKKSQSLPALREAMTKAIRFSGYQQFAYVRFAKDSPHVEESIYTYSEAWVIRYFENGYEGVDPVFVQALSQSDSFFWTSKTYERDANLWTFFKEANSFGIYQGITTPLKSASNRRAIMTIAASKTPANAGKLEADPAELAACRALSEAFHQTAITLSKTYSTNLKPREQEILSLASFGLTSEGIAAVLGIGIPYVNEVMTSLMHKLGTNSRTAAVRRAMELGLIE